jgi:hypothetical protein
MLIFLLAIVTCLVGAFAIHTATRALMGKAADNLPGGALAFVGALVMASPNPWWLTISSGLLGAAAGHLFSVWIWRARDLSSVRPKSID